MYVSMLVEPEESAIRWSAGLSLNAVTAVTAEYA